jgi:hypothetical protein
MVSISRKQQEQQVCGNEHVGRVKRIRTSKEERSVSLYPHVVVSPVLHRNDYTNAEKKACWFSPNEMVRINKGIDQTVQLIERKIILDNGYCSRGLETLTTKGRIQKKQIRARARDAVLDKQVFLQWQAGSMIMLDEQRIADVYRGITRESRIAAYIKGVSDAATIRAMDVVQQMAARTKIMEPQLGHYMSRALSPQDHLRSRTNKIVSAAA